MSSSNAKCPMCGAIVKVPSDSKLGDMVYCDQCDAELEVINLKPLELDWPLDDYEEEYDYDDEDGYYDDDEDYDDDDYDD